MTDSPPERAVVNFGDVDLSDVCLVVGDTDFNVHKMVLASRSSYFKTLFFGDFKEKNENRITMGEDDPTSFQRMLEILYNGRCANETFFKCRLSYFEARNNFTEVFWKEGVPLWQLLDRYDVQLGMEYFEDNLSKYCCSANTSLYTTKSSLKNRNPTGDRVSTCSSCVLRKVFAMQHGINLKVSAFDSSSIQSAVNIAREKKVDIDGDVLAELVGTMMRLGLK